MQLAKKLNITDTLLLKWQDVVTNLVDFPADENGFRIGADQPYAKSHRHYSHLLMIYPLHILDPDQKNNREIIQRSLAFWHSKPGALQGYSFTGGASIAAALGNGDAALDYLNGLFGKFLKANTLYAEDGPVIETPLSGGQAITEMLLQSWGDKIRVFPAIPVAWKNAAFENLRTEGAFLISAKRANGKTVFIKINSEAGEPCIIKTDMLRPTVQGSAAAPLIKIDDNLYRIELKKGDSVILVPQNTKVKYLIREVPANTMNKHNYFGLQ